jgi:small GTP-binding protein
MSEKIEDRIKELQERMDQTQKNKHTQRSINYIRAQMAKLKDQLVDIATSKKGGGSGFGVKKTGDAQVAFIGFPSVGKSSLLNLLTEGHTDSRVASYDFTTLTAIPGMMKIEQAKVQLVDLPGIILGAASGKGRGKEIIGAARTADLILILICFKPDGTIKYQDLDVIRKELFDAGIRLNCRVPRIDIKPRNRGGIGLTYQGHQILELEDVKGILNEMGVTSSGVYFYDPDITADELIDHVLHNRVYSREFVVINKSDLMQTPISPEEITKTIGHDHWMMISALNNEHIRDLQHQIFIELGLIRVFLKPPGQDADMNEPIVLHQGDNLEVLCRKLHKSFVESFRYALIWGTSVKHPGQKFSTTEQVLEDGDIVSIYLKR